MPWDLDLQKATDGANNNAITKAIGGGGVGVGGGGNVADRFNKGKPQLAFNTLGAVIQKLEAEVWAFGAEKYAAGNWLKGCSVMKSADSLQRHLTAYLNGEDMDAETKLSALGHIICSAKILAQGHIMGFDDRPKEVQHE
jgi:hypothetical protein